MQLRTQALRGQEKGTGFYILHPHSCNFSVLFDITHISCVYVLSLALWRLLFTACTDVCRSAQKC